MNKNNNEEKKIESTAVTSEMAFRKPGRSFGGVLVKVVIAVMVALFLFMFGFTYQVREGDCAVVMRFGAVRKEVTNSGFYMKLPWPFDKVVTYDAKSQYCEAKNLETLTKDGRNIIIQSCMVWNISDPELFHNSVGKSGQIESYIRSQMFGVTTSILGDYNLNSIVSLNKEELKITEIQSKITERVREECKRIYGIEVKDVSILRLMLPDNNMESVFNQMRADREKDIDEILINAELESNKIIKEATSDAAEIKGQGVIEAAKIKAEAEKEVAGIYAAAHEANFDLYKFLTDLDTMVESINYSTVLVVKADEYPFNILTKYSSSISHAGEDVVIEDLSYILASDKLSPEDRTALINGIKDIIENYKQSSGIVTP